MSTTYDEWHGPPRTLARAIDAALASAAAGNGEAFRDACAALHTVDREVEQLLVLLGTATQYLLERTAPDGLDAEAAGHVLRGCLRSAAPWYDGLDADALLGALTAAVGVSTDDETAPAVTPDAVLAHGLLLVAHLGTTTGTPWPEVVGHALSELHRAQTVELP